MNMKYFLIVLTMFSLALTTKAQTTEDSVKATINKMFDAMRKADGEMLKSCFSDSIVLQSIGRNPEGKMVVRTESASIFANQISNATAGALDERITYETIKVDGPLAFAWTPYSFYYNGKFSHCGVNSFQLIRFGGEWKIQYIIDTRRRQGCVAEQ